jgi:ABC-2 type transport system permease protein
VAGAGALVSLRAASVRQAQQPLSLTVMLLLFIPVFGIQALPATWQARLMEAVASIEVGQALGVVGGVLVLMDVALVVAAMARFQRMRLILD